MYYRQFVFFSLLAVFATEGYSPYGSLQAESSELKTRVDFARDVAPLLRRCQGCHGPSLQSNGLRLDRKADAFRGGSSGSPFAPGKSDESLIIKMVSGQIPNKTMPPIGERLSAEQIEILKIWINQGAEWPEEDAGKRKDGALHWAYLKPKSPPLPQVKNSAWVRNPIDHFVLAPLERESLTPTPEAPRETLVRRLSLDLLGLPPSSEIVKNFLADRGPHSYEKLIDGLLSSPHFGEHWAQQWLDLARYADTNGYESDEPRTHWAWRDWVVSAFNQNLPFDQFTIEQLAGDLLPGATEDQIIATGFHRNTLINDEAGAKADEFYDAAVKDRVDTTAAVWLGSTLGCAQCHNHKYDPFTQRDYYQLYAVLNNTADSGIQLSAQMPVFKGDKAELRRREAEVAKRTKILDTQTPELAAKQAVWEASTKAKLPLLKKAWQPLQPDRLVSSGGAELKTQEDGSIFVGGKNPDNDAYELEIKTNLKNITGFRLEAIADKALPGGGPGRAEKGDFTLSGFEVEAWTQAQIEQQSPYRENHPEWDSWHEIGPFRVLTQKEAFDKAFGPENNYDLLEVYEDSNLFWMKRDDWKDGVIRPLEGDNCARYLYRSVTVRQPTPVWASLGSDKGIQLWLNKKKILSKNPTREIAPDQEWVRLDLKPGKNEILIKLTNDTGKFGFYFRSYVGTEKDARILLKSAVAEYGEERQELAGLPLGMANSAWSIDRLKESDTNIPQAIFQMRPVMGTGEATTLNIHLRNDSFKKQSNLGRFRLWATTLESATVAELIDTPSKIRTYLSIPSEQRSGTQRQEISAHYRSVAPALAKVRAEHQKLVKQLELFRQEHTTTALVLTELPKPRESHIQKRGNFLTPGDSVNPGTPQVLSAGMPAPGASGNTMNRLSFARWLVDKENPLTARVRVNQIWASLFGRGIVPTMEDFGSQGEPPSHPDLLDWLATEYIRLNWDTKALLKEIVSSATYRQSAEVTAEKLEKDPNNALLSRGARYRVRAETVRDIALSASGLLSRKVGGPSVFPPQPASVLEDHFIEGGFKVWPLSQGEDRYRRGLYTFYKRTAAYPTFTAFDAPDRTVCTVKRPRSNTPLQALTTLNDPVFVEAAGRLAKRMVTETTTSNHDRIRHGYQLVLSRAPTGQEATRLLSLLDKVSTKYQADPKAARKAVASTYFGHVPKIDPRELAPWIVVANVLLNLDETITRE